ncbi:MAG: O-antigen ligase family protein [Thermodesulfobacteriota bacterium]
MFRLGATLLGTESLTVAKLFTILTFFFWVTNILVARDIEGLINLIREKANILVLIFLALSVISLIGARYFNDETIMELSGRIKMLALYFLIVGIIRDQRTLKLALLAFIIGSLPSIGAGLYELATGEAVFQETPVRAGYIGHLHQTIGSKGLIQTAYGKSRVQSIYCDPGFHAHAMVIFFGLAVPWLFYSTPKKIKILVGILLSFYMINIISTGARVGWVAFSCALFMFLLLLKHRYKYILWVFSIALLIIIFLALSFVTHIPTLERLHTKRDISYEWRLDTSRLALEMVRDHPLLGVGTGNYLTEYHNYLHLRPSLSRYHYGWLNNSYLQIWAENGTIGLLVFLFFLLAIFLGLLATYLKAVDLEMKTLSLGLLISFTGYAVELSGIPAIDQEPGWMILGLGVALIAIEKRGKKAQNPI